MVFDSSTAVHPVVPVQATLKRSCGVCLTLLVLQSPFVDEPSKLLVVCPQTGTAVRKGPTNTTRQFYEYFFCRVGDKLRLIVFLLPRFDSHDLRFFSLLLLTFFVPVNPPSFSDLPGTIYTYDTIQVTCSCARPRSLGALTCGVL